MLPELPSEALASRSAPAGLPSAEGGFDAPPEGDGLGEDRDMTRLITHTVERSLFGATNCLNPGPHGADLRRTLHAGAEPRTAAERHAVL